MGRRRGAWAGSAVAGGAALVAAVLGPVTNYASAAAPGWAAQAWVIWPVFAVLVAVSIGLLLWGRHLDAAVEAAGLAAAAATAAGSIFTACDATTCHLPSRRA